jgi:hypothetical protein
LPDGTGGMMAVLASKNPDYFNSNRLETWLKTDSIGSIIDYFDNKLSPASNDRTEDMMIKTEQKDSSKSENDIYKDIVEAKDSLYKNID